ncbi:MAG TPA: ferric reductase-like transmembrane domain-containing protein [Ilumatobacteraceae bacterium]
MTALTQSLALWYFTRGTGAMSLLLLTVAFVSGTPTLLSWGAEHLPRLVVQLFHRNVSLLVMVFIGLHVATTVVDGFAPIGWLDAIVPFRSGYRPIWLGLGAVAVDLLVAVIITSLWRVRIGYATWRYVHMLTYLLWPIALVHALGTGSDTRARWMWVLDGVCAVAVLASVLWRLTARRPADDRVRLAAIGALVIVPVLVGVWLTAGPLKPTWGRAHHHAAPATDSTTGVGVGS